jgi:hypothetical protein
MLLVGVALVVTGLVADVAWLWALGTAVTAVGGVVLALTARRVAPRQRATGGRRHLRVVE